MSDTERIKKLEEEVETLKLIVEADNESLILISECYKTQREINELLNNKINCIVKENITK